MEWRDRTHPDGRIVFSLYEDEEEADWMLLEAYGQLAIRSLKTSLKVLTEDMAQTTSVSSLSLGICIYECWFHHVDLALRPSFLGVDEEVAEEVRVPPPRM